MSRPFAVLCLLLLAPVPAVAEKPKLSPEQLLAADTVVYLRFDGLEAHRKAYEQTALGEVMKGDLGRLMDYSVAVVRDSLGPVLVKGQLLEGTPSEKLKSVREGFNRLPDVFHYLGRHGVVLGVEAAGPPAVVGQLTLIFPDVAPKDRQALFGAFELLAALGQVPVKHTQVGGRDVSELDVKAGPARVGWWQEGEHVVFVVGTGGPAHTVKLAEGKSPTLNDNPLYRSVTRFKGYETFARGFIDFERGRKLLGLFSPQATQILARTGLDHLQHLTMQFGFEGRQERSTVTITMPGGGEGLRKIFPAGARFEVGQLPAVPPDATTVQAFHLDWGNLYDLVFKDLEGIAEAVEPEAKGEVADAPRKINQALGIDVRKDLLEALGPLTVLYNSPSEGAASLGVALVIQVKDGDKVRQSLQTLFQSLTAVTGVDVSVKKQAYQGAELHTVRFAQQGFFFVPTYAVHKDWLVIGMFPQTVQGFLLRSGGNYSAWKPTALVNQALAAATRGEAGAEGGPRVVSVGVTDPRPSIKQLCTIAPLVAGLVNSFASGSFDLSKLPNAQAVTEPLFPNVSVMTLDGDTLRLESHASVSLPFDMVGLDSFYATIFGFSLLRIGF